MVINKRYKTIILGVSILVLLEAIAIIFLLVSRPKKPAKVSIPVKGRIAIILDDWGYNLDNLRILDQMRYPFTASVLPKVAYSRTVALELHKRGAEVMLHLPMEPFEGIGLEKNTIMVSTGEQDIIKIIGQDLADIHYAVGVSNHMGSRATGDSRVMSIVLNELKRRNLFFVDSFVSSRSVCSALAGKLKIRFAKRDVFLDDIEDPVYIKGQVDELKKKARMYGYAVGIGHDRRVTLEVLKETIPGLVKEGYKLVFVSKLVK